MDKDTEITAKKVRGVPFKKGDDPRRNTDGRPKGSEDFKTKWFRAIEKIGSQNNMTADEIEEQLLLVGYKKAKEGDYSFYKDVFDRAYGKATDNKNVKVEGNIKSEVTNPKAKEVAEKYEEELKQIYSE